MSNATKPITVAQYEFVAELRELVNSSPLPYFVIESILKDFYADVKLLSKQQLESDMERYKKTQKENGDAQ